MPRFSNTSLDRLATCDERLQALCHEVIQVFDFTVLEGHRGKAAQDAAVAKGASKAAWPTSKHNSTPSLAVDVAPWPVDWQDTGRFRELAVHMLQQAEAMKLQVVWGGHWKTLVDMPHYQIEAGELTPFWRQRLEAHLASYGRALPPLEKPPSENIPEQILAALIQVESGGNQYAMRYEPAFFKRYVEGKPVQAFGACSLETERTARATSWGPLQIMGAVARELGYQKPFLSQLCGPDGLAMGVLYLQKLAAKFLDSHGWAGVVSAYNAGPGGIGSNPSYIAKVLQALGGKWPEVDRGV